MQLLHSCAVSTIQYVSLSIVVKPTNDTINVSDGSKRIATIPIIEPLIIPSITTTLSYDECHTSVQELQSYISDVVTAANTVRNSTTNQTTITKFDTNTNSVVYDLLREDDKYITDTNLQIYHPKDGAGINMHYRILRNNNNNNNTAATSATNDPSTIISKLISLVLSGNKMNTTATTTGSSPTNNGNNNNTATTTSPKNNGICKINNTSIQVYGILISIGSSGIQYGAYGCTKLVTQLNQRLNDVLTLLNTNTKVYTDTAACKNLLSNYLLMDDEIKLSNDLYNTPNSLIVPEPVSSSTSNRNNTTALSLLSPMGIISPLADINSGGKNKSRRTVVTTGNNVSANDTGTRSSTDIGFTLKSMEYNSMDLSRIVIEKLRILSVAENDSKLLKYTVSGIERKTNSIADIYGALSNIATTSTSNMGGLSGAGTTTSGIGKSRFRRPTRKADKADFDNFDYKGGPVNRDIHTITKGVGAIYISPPTSGISTTTTGGGGGGIPTLPPPPISTSGNNSILLNAPETPSVASTSSKFTTIKSSKKDTTTRRTSAISNASSTARRTSGGGGVTGGFGNQSTTSFMDDESTMHQQQAQQQQQLPMALPFPTRHPHYRTAGSMQQQQPQFDPFTLSSANEGVGNSIATTKTKRPPTNKQQQQNEPATDDGDQSYVSTSHGSVGSGSMTVHIALNEDLTCSYKSSQLASCNVEGFIQISVKGSSSSASSSANTTRTPPTNPVFAVSIRDPMKHIESISENKKVVQDVRPDDSAYKLLVTIPKYDTYYALLKYKCIGELRPVPIRVQTKVKADSGICRVALQVSSNPNNNANLTDLTIVMGVPTKVKGETLVTQPPGGVWDEAKSSVVWCVSELGSGEKFQLQAKFELKTDATNSELTFPVLVRCQSLFAQLSAVEVEVADNSNSNAFDISTKIARRYRLSHREKYM